jgi:protein-disulfide isomerase
VGPTLKQIQKTWPNDVKIVFKHNALPFHNRAKPAAVASMAAAKQGKFWEFHDKMFANARALTDENLEKWAGEVGCDVAQWKKDKADAAIGKQVDNEQKSAKALGQGGTPAFFINGKVLSGAQPFDKFKAVIEAELKEADKLIASGKKLEEVHKLRARANLGAKAGIYWDNLVSGKPAKAAPAPPPRAARPVDPTVWAVTLDGHEPIKGKKDALVTLVSWSDFQ